jgi:hypothetical protein
MACAYVFYAPKAHGTGRCALDIQWITVNCWDSVYVLQYYIILSYSAGGARFRLEYDSGLDMLLTNAGFSDQDSDP